MMLTPIDLATTRVMLRKELLAEGWSDSGIAAMVRAKEWVRVRHGAYVSAHALARTRCRGEA